MLCMQSEEMFFIFPRARSGFLMASCDAHEFSPKSTLLLRVHPCQGPSFMWGWGSAPAPYLSCARGLAAVPTWPWEPRPSGSLPSRPPCSCPVTAADSVSCSTSKCWGRVSSYMLCPHVIVTAFGRRLCQSARRPCGAPSSGSVYRILCEGPEGLCGLPWEPGGPAAAVCPCGRACRALTELCGASRQPCGLQGMLGRVSTPLSHPLKSQNYVRLASSTDP